jgi:RNA polymerase sigma factor (sigma-70 family)
MTPTTQPLPSPAGPVAAGSAHSPLTPAEPASARSSERGRVAGPPPPRTRPAVDARVKARFCDGDPDAVRAVYRAYGRLVYAVAYRLLGDRSLSEEATQQTFLKAWQASSRVDRARELGPWLATITRRVAIDLHRRESRRSTTPLDAVPAKHPALAATPTSVETTIDIWEVRRAVSALRAEDQQIVRLQHFEGLTHVQIAQRLGVPIGTVKSRSFRAHKRLATHLEHIRTPPPGNSPDN